MKMTLIRKVFAKDRTLGELHFVFGYLMKKLACEKDIEIVVTHEKEDSPYPPEDSAVYIPMYPGRKR